MIEETLEREIRPSLKHDGGDIELIDVIGDRVLVATRGTCAVCKASEQTIKNFVEAIFMRSMETLRAPTPSGARWRERSEKRASR